MKFRNTLVLALILAAIAAAPAWATDPTLPQANVTTTYNAGWNRAADYTATTIAELRTALATAAANNTSSDKIIEIAAGANLSDAATSTFSGAYPVCLILPATAGSHTIVIRSSAYATTLPATGTRVAPSNVAAMATITNTTKNPTLVNNSGANHYRFIGIEFVCTYANVSQQSFDFIFLGDYNTYLNSVAHPCSDIIFDRCYIHGAVDGNNESGIRALNISNLGVVDSYISEIHGRPGVTPDSWAIDLIGVTTALIRNNFLSAAGENVLISQGGINQPESTDITIRNNYIWKDPAWQSNMTTGANSGFHWNVKNLLELKNGQRILVESNILENNWISGQAGIAVLLNAWSNPITDFTFRLNVIHNCQGSIQINPTYNPGYTLQDVLFNDNLFYDIVKRQFTIDGQASFVPTNITIRHNTAISPLLDGSYAQFIYLETGPPAISNLTVTDNLYSDLYGIFAAGGLTGLAAFNKSPTGWVSNGYHVNNNVTIKQGAHYATTDSNFQNFFYETSKANVGFTNTALAAVADFAMSGSSAYRAAGGHPSTDAKDMGADIAAIIVGLTNGIPAPVSPTISSSSSFSVNEKQVHAGVVAATGDPTIHFTITGGADQAKFMVGDTSGVLDFVTAPIYASPTDANSDNVYLVQVTATNDSGSVNQSIAVSVNSTTPPAAIIFRMFGHTPIFQSR